MELPHLNLYVFRFKLIQYDFSQNFKTFATKKTKE